MNSAEKLYEWIVQGLPNRSGRILERPSEIPSECNDTNHNRHS